jgi:hypothetical protein
MPCVAARPSFGGFSEKYVNAHSKLLLINFPNCCSPRLMALARSHEMALGVSALAKALAHSLCAA